MQSDIYQMHGIIHERSYVVTPQQNEVACKSIGIFLKLLVHYDSKQIYQ